MVGRWGGFTVNNSTILHIKLAGWGKGARTVGSRKGYVTTVTRAFTCDPGPLRDRGGAGETREARNQTVPGLSATAILTGLEPATSTLTGWRANQLLHRTRVFPDLSASLAALRTRQTVAHAGPPGRTGSRAPPPARPQLRRAGGRPRGQSAALAASMAFRIRFSDTGDGVPSDWAKKLTRSSSIIQRIASTSAEGCCPAGTAASSSP